MFKQIFCAALTVSAALVQALPAQSLPMEPLHNSGQPVMPSYEGWWQNQDGSYNFLLGYFNRNTQQEVDIPIGADNRIEPNGDYGQPTHFYTRRHWGVFVATLPKAVAEGQKKPTWTLAANGTRTAVTLNIDPVYNIDPMSEIGIGNTPPTISLDEKGPSVQGPKQIVVERTATVNQPLSITVWAADDAKSLRPNAPPAGGRGRGPAPAGSGAAAAGAAGGAPASLDDQIKAAAAAAGVDVATAREFFFRPDVGITFEKLRGPGEVKFGAAKPRVEKIENGTIPKPEKFNGKATTTATFSEPGDYVLRIYATDSSGEGGGGFLCCWTNIYAKVTVK